MDINKYGTVHIPGHWQDGVTVQVNWLENIAHESATVKDAFYAVTFEDESFTYLPVGNVEVWNY